MKSLLLHNGALIESSAEDILESDSSYPEDAVYTSVRTYNQKPFRLEEHLIRLYQSARSKGFSLAQPIDTIRLSVIRLVEKTDLDPQFLKITATPHNLVVVSRPLEIDHDIYDGVSVTVANIERDQVQTKYVYSPLTHEAFENAQVSGHHDVLLCTEEGLITEGSRSNIFWVQGNNLYWCKNALGGITQRTVLELAQDLCSQGLQIIQTNGLSLNQLDRIDELFLTQTSRGIVPIIWVNHHTISSQPGPITQHLTKAFHHFVLSQS